MFMQRDINLIRSILFCAEERIRPITSDDIKVSGYTKEAIDYHLTLIGESGLGIVYEYLDPKGNGLRPILQRLTWSGHEFLDSVRDEVVWEKTRRRSILVTASMPFELWMKVAKNILIGKLWESKTE